MIYFHKKEWYKNEFYDDSVDGKFEVLPYIKDDVSMGLQSLQHDISRKKLNNLLRNIG